MSQHAAQDTIDLKAIFTKIARKWWLFLITVSIAVAGGVAYIKTTPKAYRVKSVLRMSEGRRAGFGQGKEEFLKGSGYLKSDAELEDEITMIRSVSNMTNTLKKLDFSIGYFESANFLTKEVYDAPPFIVRMDSATTQMCGVAVHVKVDTLAGTWRVKAKAKNVRLYDLRSSQMITDDFLRNVEIDEIVALGQPFKHEHLFFSIELPKPYVMNAKSDYFFVLNPMDELLRQWQGATSVDPMSDESNIVILTTSGEVVSKQRKFLDALMATYIESEQEKNNAKGNATIEFINRALGKSTEALDASAQQLKAVKGGTTGDAQMQALQQEIYSLQQEERNLSSKLTFLNEIASTMSQETSTTISAAGIDAPGLNSLIEQFNRDISELRARQATEIRDSQATLVLKRKIQSEKEGIVQSANTISRQTDLDLQAVRRQIATRQGQQYLAPGAEIKTNIAENLFKLNTEMNNYLMEKSYEAQIAVNSDQVDKTVVDAARPESTTPIAPDKKVVLGGAAAVGIIIPLLFILLLDFLNDKITDVDELKRLSPLPLLATIPNSKRKRITPDEPKSLLAESFRTARINLQYLNANAPRQVVGMTSSTSGEGKTFCSINIATVITLSGKRTLLIDADMRRPRVQEYLELPDGPGLSTYLIGECTLDGAIRRSGIQGLDVITAGPIPPNPLELVESPRMAELFRETRNRYDHIIVDASPMGLVSEFKVIMGHLDATLYVVRQGYTRRNMLRGVNELHRDGKLAHTSMIFNDVKAGQGYGDGYGYYTK
jgi:capsular exopolysaccharide synthesis family protein